MQLQSICKSLKSRPLHHSSQLATKIGTNCGSICSAYKDPSCCFALCGSESLDRKVFGALGFDLLFLVSLLSGGSGIKVLSATAASLSLYAGAP